MTPFRELRYWCPTHGANVLRLSMQGADGRERHCILDMDVPSQDRRRHRVLALQQLEREVNTAAPGEVQIDLEAEIG